MEENKNINRQDTHKYVPPVIEIYRFTAEEKIMSLSQGGSEEEW